jgi:Tfp pilus assembly protein PilO
MMEQFMKLPPLQKLGVLAAILVVIAGGAYFMLIDPELGRRTQNEALLKKAQKELTDLQSKASEKGLRKLRAKKDRLVEEDKENRKMLPTSNEVPDFIESVQKDAIASGLTVARFDRLKTEKTELVNAIPVKMTVQGSMLHLISFLRIYAGNDRRVITLRNVLIEDIKPNYSKLKAALDASKPLEDQKRSNKSPEEKLVGQIELRHLARKKSLVRATFVAYAYTWTGEKPESTSGKKIKKYRT